MRRIPWPVWVLVILVTVLGIPVLTGLVLRWQGQRDLATVHAEIRAMGSPATPREWVERLPAKDETALREFREAVKAFAKEPDPAIARWLASGTAATPAVHRWLATSSASRARLRTAVALPDGGWGRRFTVIDGPTGLRRFPGLVDQDPDLLATRHAMLHLMTAYRIADDDAALLDADRLMAGLGKDTLIESAISMALQREMDRHALRTRYADSRSRPRPATWGRPVSPPLAAMPGLIAAERITFDLMLRQMPMADWNGREDWRVWRPSSWSWVFFHGDQAARTRFSMAWERTPATPPDPIPVRWWFPSTHAWMAPDIDAVRGTLETRHVADVSHRSHRILADLLDRMPAGADSTTAIAALPQPHPLLAPGPDHMPLGLRVVDRRTVRVAPLPDGPWPPGMDDRYRSAWTAPRPAPALGSGPIQEHGGAIDLDLP